MYDKHPYILASTDSEDCYAGWGSIGNALRKFLDSSKKIVCVECYPGVFEGDVRDRLTALLNPSLVVMTESLSLSPPELAERVDPLLTDDPVFCVMHSIEIVDFFD